MRMNVRISMVLLYEYLCSIASLVQKLLVKTPSSSVLQCRFLIFFTPVKSFSSWPENDLSQHCRYRPLVSNDVARLSLVCFAFEISRGADIRLFHRRYEGGTYFFAVLYSEKGVSATYYSWIPNEFWHFRPSKLSLNVNLCRINKFVQARDLRELHISCKFGVIGAYRQEWVGVCQTSGCPRYEKGPYQAFNSCLNPDFLGFFHFLCPKH